MILQCTLCADVGTWDYQPGNEQATRKALPRGWMVLEVTGKQTGHKHFLPWCSKHSMDDMQAFLATAKVLDDAQTHESQPPARTSAGRDTTTGDDE